jgi:co-chaperonin GroES (HSP10)
MIKPILHRILVKQDKLDEKDEVFKAAKALGIEIARDEHSREQAAIDTGEVIEIGPTAFKDFGLDELPIKVGQTIVYARYGGKAITDPETKEVFVALNDEDVIAILR